MVIQQNNHQAPQFTWYRHGDIIVKNISNLDEKKLKAVQNGNVIAEGEETGHHHRFVSGQFTLFASPTDVQQTPVGVEVTSETASLVHEEHKEIPIEAGTYEIGRENTFNVFEGQIERVRD